MIRIPKTIYQEMLDHARREWPLECCGILSGRDKTVQKAFELQNAEESPVLYSMSPREQLKVFEEMEKRIDGNDCNLSFPSPYDSISV